MLEAVTWLVVLAAAIALLLTIIVEQRAGARDPERAQGNKPDLENPTSR